MDLTRRVGDCHVQENGDAIGNNDTEASAPAYASEGGISDENALELMAAVQLQQMKCIRENGGHAMQVVSPEVTRGGNTEYTYERREEDGRSNSSAEEGECTCSLREFQRPYLEN